MSNVNDLDAADEHVCGLSVDDILTFAYKRGLTSILVVGYDEDGYLYCNSSEEDGAELLWLIERAKLALMDAVLSPSEEDQEDD